MKDLILVLTNSGDATVEPVLERLSAMHQHFFRFDTERFLLDVTLSLGDKDRWLAEASLMISLDRVKSIWWRKPAKPMLLPEMHPGYATFIQDESRVALASLCTSFTDVFWMNHPLVATKLLEHNKLYQLAVAARYGLAVPRTIVTNDAEQILAFVREQNGAAAMKMLCGNVFAKEGSSAPLFVFTQYVTEDMICDHFEDFRLAPVMVQEYVPKKFELRVTVVGEKIFACAIYSQDSERTRFDWRRYDFRNVRHEPFTLPLELQKKLLELLKFWHLSFGAIDLIYTPDGKYVFLEINPNGQWLWIEQVTGMPISQTIAETLTLAPRGTSNIPWDL